MSVQNTKIVSQWGFPETSKTDMILTGHFINLVYTLPKGPLGLLSFLIYQAEKDNRVKYTTKLLNQYRRAVELAQEKYLKKKLGLSQPTTRRYFKALIEYGLLIPNREKHYTINPNLCFHKSVKPTAWKLWINGLKTD